MAAIALSPKTFKMQYTMPIEFKCTTLTTGDWINVSGVRGISGVCGDVASSTTNTAPGSITWLHGVALADGAVTGTTNTSVSVNGMGAHATIVRQAPFYAKNGVSGEIVEVTADSAPEAVAATWTIRRGALGTTAAAIGDNDYFLIMNQIVFASTPVGLLSGVMFAMADDPGSKPFA